MSWMTDRPDDLGFDPVSLEKAFAVVERFVQQGKIPGATACVGSTAGALRPRAYGRLSVEPVGNPVTADTLFDCASLTKVVVTTTLALRLIEEGVVRLDDPVAHFLPEFVEESPEPAREAKSQVTLRHLLTHTSGLAAWAPLYQALPDEAEKSVQDERAARGGGERTQDAPEGSPAARIVRRICRQPLVHAPGTVVEYSCLGFILLGEIIQRLKSAPLDELARRWIFAPLGMKNACFNPPPELHGRVAATEVVDGKPLIGVVHDENARSMGGVSGNAGLFATAEDLARFALMLLGKGRLGERRVLSAAALREATRDHTGHLGESRGLGWVVKGLSARSSAGDLFSPESFGHTGFTGTSLWIDPVRGIFAVLLTNRVHPTRANDAHIRLRALFHNAVAAAAGP